MLQTACRPTFSKSLLYRLWGRVVSQQVLNHWANVFPRAITGFLPRRSAQAMLYHIQAKLEQVHMGLESHHWSGLTLALVKCFNCLPRQPARCLLNKFGLPDEIIQCWFSSIERLQRWWLVNQQMHSTGYATTGCPEGDTFSVIVMLAINYMWTVSQESDDMILNAFADNWSYATCNRHLHRPILTYIVRLCDALKITIDWKKTWAWATNAIHKSCLQRVSSLILPQDISLQLVSHARELGYIMHYRCQQFRGTIKTRHNAAIGRLKKLQLSDAPMHVKAQIARASCIGKAMFGAETFALGERYFSTLRTGIAYALLGPKRNIQPYIACMCLSRFLIDPELYVIQNAIRKARAYLVFASPQNAQAFYEAHVLSRCPAAQIIGPAAALKWYLSKLGWTMTRDGTLHIGSFFQLHICESNLEDILLATEDSWMEHVADMMHTRHFCRNIPPIDHILSRSVFEKMPEKTKRAVAMQIVGGYMTNTQKQHFDSQQSELCSYCNQLDSVHHRLLECPATEVIRQQYPEVVEFLHEHDPIHLVFPLCFRDPAFEFHRTLQYKLPGPEVDCQLLSSDSVVFTDGSCRHPADMRYRRASYAAVTPTEQSYSTLVISHCQGRQTIPRAELAAVVSIETNATVDSIVTDSAYVLHVKQKLLQTSDIRDLHEEKTMTFLNYGGMFCKTKEF